MHYYYAILEVGNDKEAHSVRFPDLPNVFSAADNEDDITTEAMQALELWAEDEDMPAPSSFTDLQKREDVKQALAEGCVLIRIPFIKRENVNVPLTISMDKSSKDAIVQRAKELKLGNSKYVVHAVLEEIKRNA